ncbi:AMP deaminase [Rhizina undulata]
MPDVINIESLDQFQRLLADTPEDGLLALSFHTPWAAPCKQMNVVFSTLAAQSPSTITFASIDAESHPEISETYDVAAVPYFVLLKSGKRLESLSGANPKQLSDALAKHSGASLSLPPPQAAAPANGATQGEAEEGVQGEEDIETRLAKLVSAAPVMLFMKGTPAAPQCGFSRQLVALLRERGVRYGFFNILADDEVRQGLKKFSDWPTYPQLYLGGELVGGLDIVKEEFERDPDFLKDQSVKT